MQTANTVADRSTETASVAMALGRIFGMMQREARAGDVEEYERCRALVIGALKAETDAMASRPNWARDRKRGAAGD